MNVTYIEHSGFIVELKSEILLFDYFKGNIPRLDNNKPIYVFSSHNHHDHFNFKIFELMSRYSDVHYILSNDIKRKFGKNFFTSNCIDEKTYNSIQFIPADSEFQDNYIKIETLKSTDEGVAFIVTAGNKTIYHAGDLNLWVWQGESDAYNSKMTSDFQHEIAKINNRHFDIAFLPLDPRQEDWFYKGFDYFMTHTDTDIAYPMHFWNSPSVIDKLKNMECSAEYRNKIADTNKKSF